MSAKVKLPTGCFYKNGRDGVIYGRAKIAGKLENWSLRTDNPRIAGKRREEEKAKRVGQAYFGDAPALFEDVMKKWGDNLVTSGSDKTHMRYFCSMKQMMPFLAGRKLYEIDRRLIGDMVEERSKHVENATVRRDLSALSSLMGYAVDRGWCAVNPVQPIARRIKEQRDPINLPHDPDIELVISRAPGLWPYLIRAALLTGCREDELIKATRRDFDAVGRTLTVLGKGNKSRVIDLNWNGGYTLFESIPAFAGKSSLFWRHEDKRVRGDSKRAPTFRGDPIEDPGPTFARIGNGTDQWAAENGVAFVRFCFHDLRHRHAIDYLRSGGNIYDLRDRLGHETLAMTEKYLKHVTPEQARIAKYGKPAAIPIVQRA